MAGRRRSTDQRIETVTVRRTLASPRPGFRRVRGRTTAGLDSGRGRCPLPLAVRVSARGAQFDLPNTAFASSAESEWAATASALFGTSRSLARTSSIGASAYRTSRRHPAGAEEHAPPDGVAHALRAAGQLQMSRRSGGDARDHSDVARVSVVHPSHWTSRPSARIVSCSRSWSIWVMTPRVPLSTPRR